MPGGGGPAAYHDCVQVAVALEGSRSSHTVRVIEALLGAEESWEVECRAVILNARAGREKTRAGRRYAVCIIRR